MKPMQILTMMALSLAPLHAAAGEAGALERWDRAVCLYTELAKPDAKSAMELATAFLVSRDESLFLVTAAHCARNTGAATKILYRTSEGESRWVALAGLVERGKDPWAYHPTSDVATIRLDLSALDEATKSTLRELAIGFELLAIENPPRTTEIEIAGFPIALGTSPAVSPLVMKGSIASRETLAEAKWGAEPVLFVLPTVGAGSSGGPVFLSHSDRSQVEVVVLYIGMVFDDSGVKLSKIVPAHVLRGALGQAAAQPEPAPVSE